MKLFATLLFTALAIFTAPTYAEIVPDLYTAHIQVADYTNQAKQIAFSKALQQVLFKLSGNLKLISSPIIQDQIKDPSQLVASYSYSKQQIANTTILLLNIKFATNSIKQILVHAGQSLLNSNRPTLLVWLAITTHATQFIVSDEDRNIAPLLRLVAHNNGLPIILPLLDLQDISAINMLNIRNQDKQIIQEASKRYNPDAILIGNIELTGAESWQAQWLLITANRTVTRNETAANIDQILMQTMAKIVAELATRSDSNPTPTSKEKLLILVTEVRDLATCATVTKYLEKLPQVSKTELVNVAQDNITIQITSTSDEEDIISALTKDNHLIPLAPQADLQPKNIDLAYRWNMEAK